MPEPPERHACQTTVASGPIWENRPCMIPATYLFRDQWLCHVHAPARLIRGRRAEKGRARAWKSFVEAETERGGGIAPPPA